MRPKLIATDSLSWVLSKSLCKQVTHALTDFGGLWNLVASIRLVKRHIWIERRAEEEQCEYQAAKSEDVDLFSDWETRVQVNLLWCLILSCRLSCNIVLDVISILIKVDRGVTIANLSQQQFLLRSDQTNRMQSVSQVRSFLHLPLS